MTEPFILTIAVVLIVVGFLLIDSMLNHKTEHKKFEVLGKLIKAEQP